MCLCVNCFKSCVTKICPIPYITFFCSYIWRQKKNLISAKMKIRLIYKSWIKLNLRRKRLQKPTKSKELAQQIVSFYLCKDKAFCIHKGRVPKKGKFFFPGTNLAPFSVIDMTNSKYKFFVRWKVVHIQNIYRLKIHL